MSRLDEIRARVGNIEAEDMSLHEQDRACLLDLVERAVPMVQEVADNVDYEETAEERQWLRDVRGEDA